MTSQLELVENTGLRTRPKPPSNPKSLATLSRVPVNFDSDDGERHLAVSGNALDHTVIMVGPPDTETLSLLFHLFSSSLTPVGRVLVIGNVFLIRRPLRYDEYIPCTSWMVKRTQEKLAINNQPFKKFLKTKSLFLHVNYEPMAIA